MTLASILAGETQVVLRQAYLSQRVEVTEWHPQKAFVHFQQVFLFGKPEKCPELFALCMSFQTPATQQQIIHIYVIYYDTDKHTKLPHILPLGPILNRSSDSY